MQPGPFLLERLVAIFEALHPTTDAVGCSDELRGAEMLAQVTSLVQLRLLVAVNAGNEVRLGAPPSPRPLPYGYMDPQVPDGGVVSQMLAGTSATWTTQRWSSSRRGSTRPSSSRIISSSLFVDRKCILLPQHSFQSGPHRQTASELHLRAWWPEL